MKNKKITGSLLMGLLLLCLLPTPARAAAVDIMFSDPSAAVGNTVTVNVYSTTAIAGVDMTLVYDTDYLQYSGFSGGLGNASVQDNGGSLTVVDYHSSAVGRFSLDLRFTARAIGSTTLRPTACNVSDGGGDRMDVEYLSHSSSIRISSGSTDCRLSALYIEPGRLEPAFSPQVTDYKVTVPNSADWLAVTPVKSDEAAVYTVSGNDDLQVGLNYVTVTVTAGSGAQRTYTLAVTREAAQPRSASPEPTAAAPTPAAAAPSSASGTAAPGTSTVGTPGPTAASAETPTAPPLTLDDPEPEEDRDSLRELQKENASLRLWRKVLAAVSLALLISTAILGSLLSRRR